jgi:hypothetical protein
MMREEDREMCQQTGIMSFRYYKLEILRFIRYKYSFRLSVLISHDITV